MYMLPDGSSLLGVLLLLLLVISRNMWWPTAPTELTLLHKPVAAVCSVRGSLHCEELQLPLPLLQLQLPAAPAAVPPVSHQPMSAVGRTTPKQLTMFG
jgi:hypothetical protein